MATILPRNASDTVSWLRGRSGEPLVLTDDPSLSEMGHKIPWTESRNITDGRPILGPSVIDMRDAAPDHHHPTARSSTSSGSSRGAGAETR